MSNFSRYEVMKIIVFFSSSSKRKQKKKSRGKTFLASNNFSGVKKEKNYLQKTVLSSKTFFFQEFSDWISRICWTITPALCTKESKSTSPPELVVVAVEEDP